MKTNCNYCGKEIDKLPFELKSHKNHFCSRECQNKWQKNISGENHKNWNRVKTNCSYCGKELLKIPSRVKLYKKQFCNISCLAKRRKENSIEKNCDYCGKEIKKCPSQMRSKHHFCSMECWNKWQKTIRGEQHKDWNRVPVNCKNCGKEILVWPSNLKLVKNKFCSSECHYIWQKTKGPHSENHPFWKQKEIVCDFCGEKINVIPYRFKQSKKHFCNITCYSNWLKRKPRTSVEKNCDFCGEKINVMPSKIKKFKHHFCNKVCFFRWEKINNPKGKNSPVWNGGAFPYYGDNWIKQKKKILKRANFVSEISGTNGGKMVIHHIIPRRVFTQKYIDLCLSDISSINLLSFKVLPYDLIPLLIFEEANSEENLIHLTQPEHAEFEGMPPTFFEAIKDADSKEL